MAYEYNPTSARFEIPNPHRVETIFLGICAAICLGTALVMLFEARGIYLHHDVVHFAKIVAPTSPTDSARIDALNVLNAKSPPASALADLPTAAMPSIGGATRAPHGRFCTNCGRPAASADAVFCGSSGTRLA